MDKFTLLLLVLILCVLAFHWGRARALELAGTATAPRLNSLPAYYGYYVALWCGLPALMMMTLWLAFETYVITQQSLAVLPEAMLGLSLIHI